MSTERYRCADCGEPFERPPTKGQRPRWCVACRVARRHGSDLPESIRLAVFERDGWVCQICMEPIDRDAEPKSAWAPSVDHIVCRAWTGEPDHSMENLRAAHIWCNAVRSDERKYSDADFRQEEVA